VTLRNDTAGCVSKQLEKDDCIIAKWAQEDVETLYNLLNKKKDYNRVQLVFHKCLLLYKCTWNEVHVSLSLSVSLQMNVRTHARTHTRAHVHAPTPTHTHTHSVSHALVRTVNTSELLNTQS
jgi:hypothetical protein